MLISPKILVKWNVLNKDLCEFWVRGELDSKQYLKCKVIHRFNVR